MLVTKNLVEPRPPLEPRRTAKKNKGRREIGHHVASSKKGNLLFAVLCCAASLHGNASPAPWFHAFRGRAYRITSCLCAP
jgi:hypothetical protein